MSDLAAVRAAVQERVAGSDAFLRELVQAPSVLGAEESAQVVVERRMRDIGFAIRDVEPDAAQLAAHPESGIPLLPYAGRRNLVGELPGEGRGVLLLNGHVDVVSPEPVDQWSKPPYGAVVEDGRLYGRGAADMKGGVAAMLLAVEAARSLGPLPGDLIYQSVIEEECTGNGALAATLAGPQPDAVMIGEPTQGAVTVGGVGVIYARITLTGVSGHALSSDLRANPIDKAYAVIAGLRELEDQLNERPDAAFADVDRPYLLNVGALHGGDWPATSPGRVELDVRLGFSADVEPVAAQKLLAIAVERSSPGAEVVFRGFRAHGYSFDPETPFLRLLRSCHEEVHGTPAVVDVVRATTDLRFFQRPFPVAGAATYGPTGDRYHGVDEWVDLRSIADVATVMALVMRRWTRDAA